MKGLIIDWMDGRHLQFDDFREAEKEYENMLNEYKNAGCEIDLQLLEVKSEFNNIDISPSEKGEGCDHNFPPISGWNAHQPQRCFNCGEDF